MRPVPTNDDDPPRARSRGGEPPRWPVPLRPEALRLYVDDPEQASFLEAVGPYFAALFKSIMARVRNAHDAEDLFQETLTQYWVEWRAMSDEERERAAASLGQSPDRKHALVRVGAIGRNRSVDFRRHDNIARRVVRACKRAVVQRTHGRPPPSPERYTDVGRLQDLLNASVRRLPPRQREVYVLVDVEDLSHAEVAAMLGISRETVKKHLVAARTAMAAAMRAGGRGGGFDWTRE